MPIIEEPIHSELQTKQLELTELFAGGIREDSESDPESDSKEYVTPKSEHLEQLREIEYSSEDESTPKAEDYHTLGGVEKIQKMAEEGEYIKQEPEGDETDVPEGDEPGFTSETEVS